MKLPGLAEQSVFREPARGCVEMMTHAATSEAKKGLHGIKWVILGTNVPVNRIDIGFQAFRVRRSNLASLTPQHHDFTHRRYRLHRLPHLRDARPGGGFLPRPAGSGARAEGAAGRLRRDGMK